MKNNNVEKRFFYDCFSMFFNLIEIEKEFFQLFQTDDEKKKFFELFLQFDDIFFQLFRIDDEKKKFLNCFTI